MNRSWIGWLLDLYEDPLGGVVVWFLDENGERRQLRQRLPVVFYAAGPIRRLQALQAFINRQSATARTCMTSRMDVFARREVDVLSVMVGSPAELTPLFRKVVRQFTDLDFADADLQLSLRYAAVTGVSPLCKCRVEVDPGNMIQLIEPLEDPWALDASIPPLRIMSLAPDCDPAHREPRAVLVGVDGCTHRLSFQPPRVLLITLQSLLRTYDPDVLLTSWGDTWLLPRLMQLAGELKLPLALNRDPDAMIARREERWYFSYGQIIYRGQQALLFGRWHVDRKNAMMWSDYDLDGVLEMARVTALPVQTAARVSPGTGISAIQMLAALRHQILVPWQKQQAEMPKPAADLFAADQGGLVYQPVSGVHFNVAALDFVSMYPAIIVRFKISPETLSVMGGQDAVGQPVPQVNLQIDQARDGIVSLALAPLLEKRVALKRRQAILPAWDPNRNRDRRRSSALKWLLVTCFGYLGYKNARFGRIEAHQAVTAYGREALLTAKEVAEQSGGQILHAYVDSLFVKWPHTVQSGDLGALLACIEARTGLPIALDGIYRWVAFLPSRLCASRPVANRYFGVFENGEVKVRGIAARRRDTPSWIAAVQMELVEYLAHSGDPVQALPGAGRILRARLAQMRNGQVNLEQMLVAQRLTRDADAYRSPSPAARAALQLQEVGKVVKPGQRVRFLYTVGAPGVYAWDLPRSPDPGSLDLARYRELLLRAAREVLEPFLALRLPDDNEAPGPGEPALAWQRSILVPEVPSLPDAELTAVLSSSDNIQQSQWSSMKMAPCPMGGSQA